MLRHKLSHRRLDNPPIASFRPTSPAFVWVPGRAAVVVADAALLAVLDDTTTITQCLRGSRRTSFTMSVKC